MSPNVNAGVTVAIPEKQKHVVNGHCPGHKGTSHTVTPSGSTVVVSDPETACIYSAILLKHTARCGHRHWAFIYTQMQIRVF